MAENFRRDVRRERTAGTDLRIAGAQRVFEMIDGVRWRIYPNLETQCHDTPQRALYLITRTAASPPRGDNKNKVIAAQITAINTVTA